MDNNGASRGGPLPQTRFTGLVLVFLLIFAVVVAVASACFFVVQETTKPLLGNAELLRKLDDELRYKASDTGEPSAILTAYKQLSSGRLYAMEDSQALYPPHPALSDMMGVTNEDNPWLIPSDASERSEHNDAKLTGHHRYQHARANAVPPDTLRRYLSAVMGTTASDVLTAKRSELGTDNHALFDKIFVIPGVGGGRKEDIEANTAIMAYNASGLCKMPLEILPDDGDDGSNEFCHNKCFSHNAKRIKTPFLAGSNIYTNEEGGNSKFYCWSGPQQQNYSTETSSSSGNHHYPCSSVTATLVLTDDGGWQCRPSYPVLFGGRDGTVRTACKYDPRVHNQYAGENVYVDLNTGQTIETHVDFGAKSSFMRIISNTQNISEFKQVCADPDLFFNNPVTCKCENVTDLYDNNVLSGHSRSRMKFSGCYECASNPCFMTKVSTQFGLFSAIEGTCLTSVNTPFNAKHALVGDVRTPLVGALPAMGLELAVPDARIDSDINDLEAIEENAKKVTRMVAPVVPSLALDADDPSRNTLYVPVPSMTLPGGDVAARLRPSSVLHRSCLPPMMSSSTVDHFREPLASASFFVEPAADVLAGHVPQKPYEHDLLVAESLRNSRMVSGNVLGGSELLFSNLLSVSDAEYDEMTDRLKQIRGFYEEFMTPRRLSYYEYSWKTNNGTDEDIHDVNAKRYSEWDRYYRAVDLFNNYIPIKTNMFMGREGVLLRSYGPYAALALCSTGPDAVFDTTRLAESPSRPSRGPSVVSPVNPLQLAYPTSLSVLQSDTLQDEAVIFNQDVVNNVFGRKFGDNVYELFGGEYSHVDIKGYNVSPDINDWGLQTFRADVNPHYGPYTTADRRLVFDDKKLASIGPNTRVLPLSLFKLTPIEWGNVEGDIEKASWLRSDVDTSVEYKRMLKETSIVLRPSWFMPSWENDNYYMIKTRYNKTV